MRHEKTGAESLRLSAPVFGRCLIYTEIEILGNGERLFGGADAYAVEVTFTEVIDRRSVGIFKIGPEGVVIVLNVNEGIGVLTGFHYGFYICNGLALIKVHVITLGRSSDDGAFGNMEYKITLVRAGCVAVRNAYSDLFHTVQRLREGIGAIGDPIRSKGTIKRPHIL